MKWITTNDKSMYEKSLDLRQLVLRTPLGMILDRENLNEENSAILTVWDGDECVGTMVLREEDPQTARMRYVAVHFDWQKLGIGKMMNKEFEEEAIRRGYSRVYMHARVVACEFYTKLGYEVYGEEFIESTLPHRHA